MINELRGEYKKFVQCLNGQSIIENLKRIECDSLYSWATFLNRLLYNHKTEWSNKFFVTMPKKKLVKLCKNLQ